MYLSDYQTPRYQSYMLRCWEICSQNPDQSALWRFSLEDSQNGKKIGFADLDTLLVFLRAEFDPQHRYIKQGDNPLPDSLSHKENENFK